MGLNGVFMEENYLFIILPSQTSMYKHTLKTEKRSRDAMKTVKKLGLNS